MEFDPREKNCKYLTRDTSGQLEFISTDGTNGFAHHGIYDSMTPAQGRTINNISKGRANTSYREIYLSTDGVRKFDEPYDYYRDPRNPS